METDGCDTQIIMRQESNETDNTNNSNIILEIDCDIVTIDKNCITDDSTIDITEGNN